MSTTVENFIVKLSCCFTYLCFITGTGNDCVIRQKGITNNHCWPRSCLIEAVSRTDCYSELTFPEIFWLLHLPFVLSTFSCCNFCVIIPMFLSYRWVLILCFAQAWLRWWVHYKWLLWHWKTLDRIWWWNSYDFMLKRLDFFFILLRYLYYNNLFDSWNCI